MDKMKHSYALIVYTLISASLRTQTGPNSLQLTLTDGIFDLDGIANGIIVDPVTVGSGATPAANVSGSGGGGSPPPPDIADFPDVEVAG